MALPALFSSTKPTTALAVCSTQSTAKSSQPSPVRMPLMSSMMMAIQIMTGMGPQK